MAFTTTQAGPAALRITRCDAWSDFAEAIRNPSPRPAAASATISSTSIFRGQALAAWSLCSTWERHLEQWRSRYENMRGVCEPEGEGISPAVHALWRTQLGAFVEVAASLPDAKLPVPEDENAWLALGRHHGMVSPTLDWSESPYIAAFFATTEALLRPNPALRSGVWAMEPHRLVPWTVALDLPQEPCAVWRFYLGHQIRGSDEFTVIERDTFQNRRLHAQRGVMTKLVHRTHRSLDGHLSARGLGYLLERIELPGTAIPDALHDLEKMNITFASLFPDLDGAARQASWGNLWSHLREHPAFTPEAQ